MSLLLALVAMTYVLGEGFLVQPSTVFPYSYLYQLWQKSVIHRSSLVIRQVVLDVLLDLGIPI